MTTKSNIEEKIQYEKEKVEKIQEKIKKEGGRFNPFEIIMHTNIVVIKKFLFYKKIIDENEFKLEYNKKVQENLNSVLKGIKEIKKEQVKKIILPNMVPPKGFKKVKA